MAPERAQETERILKDILDKTPKAHPDRKLIEGLVQISGAYNNAAHQGENAMVQTPESIARSPEQLLDSAIQEYKANPNSPEALTHLNRTFYEVYGQRIGLAIDVPDCGWTGKEVKVKMPTVKDRKLKSMVLFYPSELRGREGLIRIGKMFGLTNWSVQENTPIVSDESIPAGWVRIEAAIDAPNRNTREHDLVEHTQKHNLFGQGLNIYILGSRFAKLLEGRYFDQGSTCSCLPGSRYEGRMVYAYCLSGGYVSVNSDWDPDDRNPYLGARFAGVKSS